MSFPTIQRRHAIASINQGVVQLPDLQDQGMPVNVLSKDLGPAEEDKRDVAIQIPITAETQILPFNHAS